MSAQVLLFPMSAGQFVPRVEVREHWSRDGRRCSFAVTVYDHHGLHVVETCPDPDEAEAYATGFREAHREFARDRARRKLASTRAPKPWWIDADDGGAA